MAIRRSAAAGMQDLVAALSLGAPEEREAAAARLTAIGPRAVPHLIDGYARTTSAVARATILKVLESMHDRRAMRLALAVVADPEREAGVTTAAIGVLATFLDASETQALETLGAIVVDQDRPDFERLAAWQALERVPERILAPLRKRLARDRSAALRRCAAAPRSLRAPAALDPIELLEAASMGEGADPAAVAGAVAAAGLAVPLPTLHHLLERCRARCNEVDADADREEWMRARGAVHAALARRGSRVALYDVTDALRHADGPLPDDFATAAALVGDAECFEAVGEALSRLADATDLRAQPWRDRLLHAGRAIAQRERLTRRHASVRRVCRRHPTIADALLR